jgi:hypothetical protein
MAGEVDRVLHSLQRVETLETELHNTDWTGQGWIRVALVSARERASHALEALRHAARRGDPEAEVALNVLSAQET